MYCSPFIPQNITFSITNFVYHFQKKAWAEKVANQRMLAVGGCNAGQPSGGRTSIMAELKRNLKKLGQSYPTLGDKVYMERTIGVLKAL